MEITPKILISFLGAIKRLGREKGDGCVWYLGQRCSEIEKSRNESYPEAPRSERGGGTEGPREKREMPKEKHAAFYRKKKRYRLSPTR